MALIIKVLSLNSTPKEFFD
jgi:hypothetical protein